MHRRRLHQNRHFDWDRASHGPRELDLTFAVLTYFPKPDLDRVEFSALYGYDITAWTGWP